MAQVKELRPKDFSRILQAVPQLVKFPVKQMWTNADLLGSPSQSS